MDDFFVYWLLKNIYLFDCVESELQHVRSFIAQA